MDLDKLDIVDYVILASIKNGVKKYTDIFKNCKKTNVGKLRALQGNDDSCGCGHDHC